MVFTENYLLYNIGSYHIYKIKGQARTMYNLVMDQHYTIKHKLDEPLNSFITYIIYHS